MIVGQVIVTPSNGEPIIIEAGDLVVFPRGLSCVWDVKEYLHKKYTFSRVDV